MDDFVQTLTELKAASRPQIQMLTMLADDLKADAADVVQAIEQRLLKAVTNEKLPVLYLIDSIVKNGAHDYLQLFSRNIDAVFLRTFNEVDTTVRQAMYKLRQTWTGVFPTDKLHSIDSQVHQVDRGWPIVSSTSSQSTSTTTATTKTQPNRDPRMKARALATVNVPQPRTVIASSSQLGRKGTIVLDLAQLPAPQVTDCNKERKDRRTRWSDDQHAHVPVILARAGSGSDDKVALRTSMIFDVRTSDADVDADGDADGNGNRRERKRSLSHSSDGSAVAAKQLLLEKKAALERQRARLHEREQQLALQKLFAARRPSPPPLDADLGKKTLLPTPTPTHVSDMRRIPKLRQSAAASSAPAEPPRDYHPPDHPPCRPRRRRPNDWDAPASFHAHRDWLLPTASCWLPPPLPFPVLPDAVQQADERFNQDLMKQLQRLAGELTYERLLEKTVFQPSANRTLFSELQAVYSRFDLIWLTPLEQVKRERYLFEQVLLDDYVFRIPYRAINWFNIQLHGLQRRLLLDRANGQLLLDDQVVHRFGSPFSDLQSADGRRPHRVLYRGPLVPVWFDGQQHLELFLDGPPESLRLTQQLNLSNVQLSSVEQTLTVDCGCGNVSKCRVDVPKVLLSLGSSAEPDIEHQLVLNGESHSVRFGVARHSLANRLVSLTDDLSQQPQQHILLLSRLLPLVRVHADCYRAVKVDVSPFRRLGVELDGVCDPRHDLLSHALQANTVTKQRLLLDDTYTFTVGVNGPFPLLILDGAPYDLLPDVSTAHCMMPDGRRHRIRLLTDCAKQSQLCTVMHDCPPVPQVLLDVFDYLFVCGPLSPSGQATQLASSAFFHALFQANEFDVHKFSGNPELAAPLGLSTKELAFLQQLCALLHQPPVLVPVPVPVAALPPGPPTHVTAKPLDVGDLLKKLVQAGVIKKDEKEESSSRTDVDLTDLKNDKLTKRYQFTVDAVYAGQQCRICGQRFATHCQVGKTQYAEHADWHFMQKRTEAEQLLLKARKCRRWFLSAEQWLSLVAVDCSLPGPSSSELCSKQDRFRPPPTIDSPAQSAVLPADSPCELCGELFEAFWDEEQEEWRFKDCVLLVATNKLYHRATCFDEWCRTQLALATTPTQQSVADNGDATVSKSTSTSPLSQNVDVDFFKNVLGVVSGK